jgi:hypothetical protein
MRGWPSSWRTVWFEQWVCSQPVPINKTWLGLALISKASPTTDQCWLLDEGLVKKYPCPFQTVSNGLWCHQFWVEVAKSYDDGIRLLGVRTEIQPRHKPNPATQAEKVKHQTTMHKLKCDMTIKLYKLLCSEDKPGFDCSIPLKEYINHHRYWQLLPTYNLRWLGKIWETAQCLGYSYLRSDIVTATHQQGWKRGNPTLQKEKQDQKQKLSSDLTTSNNHT